MEKNTARNFALQLGALISLYLSLIFLLVLVFGTINLAFPDDADSVWNVESYMSQVRFGFAMVIVFFPTLLVLTRTVNRIRRTETDGTYLTLTRWLIYLSLVVSGLVLLGDLVAVIMSFLEGELTIRFMLKALAVFVVIGAAFYYYLKDARGHWVENERGSILFGAGTTVLVGTALVSGLFHIETPAEVREQKLDERQLSDLRDIERHIADYIRREDALPEAIADTYVAGVSVPEAPIEREPFSYRITDTGFELCASFATASDRNDYYEPRPLAPSRGDEPLIENLGDFAHGTGRVCFERVVNLDTEVETTEE